MARPSRKDERREEILEAYAHCVVHWGVSGATVQRVAEQAGLSRTLLHHYMGSREALLDELVLRFSDDAKQQTTEMLEALPAQGRCEALVAYLFAPGYASSRDELALYQALQVEAAERAELRAALKKWYEDFVAAITGEIRQQFPRAGAERAEAVATGLVALYFNADAMSALAENDEILAHSERAATLLLETLTWNGEARYSLPS